MKAKSTPRELAVAEVDVQRGVVARWEAEVAAATAELESLQTRVGEEVLADESAAGRLTRSMQELRDRIDIASRAVAAAAPKLQAASSSALLAEADEWDAEQARRQLLVDEHDAREQELRGALEAFTGLEWQVKQHEVEASGSVRYGDSAERVVIEVSPRSRLMNAVRVAERTAWCLREIAAGRDPHTALSKPFEGPAWLEALLPSLNRRDFYTPSVWGPDAVMPAPAYLRAMASGAEGQAVNPPASPGPPAGWGGIGEVRELGSGERVH